VLIPVEGTLLLVGARPLLLEAVEAALLRRGFSVAGKATSITGALTLLGASSVDCVVLDLSTPSGDALNWLNEIRRLNRDVPVVVIGAPGQDEGVQDALASGASAGVSATALPEDLVTAVRQAFRRSVFLPAKASDPGPAAKLSAREIEVLRLVADGASNAEVAQRLWVTQQTVKFHLSNVYRKLGVSNRTEAGRWAQLQGLLPERTPRAEV
jgi:DNA-binding NarL/FixJ family response regulator